MFVALPIVLVSGLVRLLALTADITLHQVYTASAVVFYGHRLARTTAESIMLLPMPSYMDGGTGLVSSDIALFTALSPVVSSLEQSSPTLGECINVVLSGFTSLVRSSLTLASSVSLLGLPTTSASVTPFLTLEPYVSALDNSSHIGHASAYPAFGPHYLDFTLVAPLAPVPTRPMSMPLGFGWCGLDSEGTHLVLANLAPAKSLVTPNTSTSLVSGRLGDHHGDVKIVARSPAYLNGNVPASSKLGWCGRGSEDAYPVHTNSSPARTSILPWTCTPSGLGFCGLGHYTKTIRSASRCLIHRRLGSHGHGFTSAHKILGDLVPGEPGPNSCVVGNRDPKLPSAFIPPALCFSKGICVLSSLASCGRSPGSLRSPHPLIRLIGSRLDNASIPSTFGSCGRETRPLHSPCAAPIPVLRKVLNPPRMVVLCYCLALLVLITLRRYAKQLYLDAPALFQVGKSPTKGNCALDKTDQAPKPVPAASPTLMPIPQGVDRRGAQPGMYAGPRKRPWIRKID